MTPTAEWIGRHRALLLATIPLSVFFVWGCLHVWSIVAAVQGHGNPMAFTWAASFLLLWWVVLSWFEKPFTATRRQQRQLDELVVTVQIPVYNEDPVALRRCIQSLFEQTRLPQRVKITDDGSHNPDQYEPIRQWFTATAEQLGITPAWIRTPNRGKRHAQVAALTGDDSDVVVTLDSDSLLERRAIGNGLLPFADPEVMSVAGMVVVWNSKANFLTMLTCQLYTPFTRGFRSAQSMLGQVMVNSGTLAFYRTHVLTEFFGAYENETFLGKAMQMNDDSFMTFAAMLKGKTVAQPNSICFTLVPESFKHYWNQQLRWMRGTNVRSLWWCRYLSPKRFGWWMPVIEWLGFVLSFFVAGYVLTAKAFDGHRIDMLVTTAAVGVVLNYTIALRYFIIRRSDESIWFQLATYALAPVAGLWRLVFLRSMMTYAILTFWKVGKWGTRDSIEVAAGHIDPDATVVIPATWLGQTRELATVKN
jgi:hyaluronan synthase